MNNQAAQTMPSVPQAFFDEFGVNADDRVWDYGRACYAAALSQTAGVAEGLTPSLRDRLQQKCSQWGTYWRAPDSHGVILNQDQAMELLRDALGVEVEVSDWMPGARSKLENWLGTYADSIPDESYHELCDIQKLMNPKPQPPAGASVSERARAIEMLAQEVEKDMTACADDIRAGKLHGMADASVRAIIRAMGEQALTQQRGEIAAWQMRSRYWEGAPWSEWQTYPSHEARESDWIPYKDSEWLRETRELYTTPQPGAEALREGYYLASFKRSHDRGYVTWWMANDAGYTSDLNQAGIYTELTPEYHDSEYTVPVPVSFIDRLRVRRMVDVGDSDNRALWTAKDLRAALADELESLLARGAE